MPVATTAAPAPMKAPAPAPAPAIATTPAAMKAPAPSPSPAPEVCPPCDCEAPAPTEPPKEVSGSIKVQELKCPGTGKVIKKRVSQDGGTTWGAWETVGTGSCEDEQSTTESPYDSWGGDDDDDVGRLGDRRH